MHLTIRAFTETPEDFAAIVDYDRILADLRDLPAKFLHTSSGETWTETLRFLAKLGFREVMRT